MGQRYTRWSLRRLSIGVVSVAVSSGVFLFSNMMQTRLPTRRPRIRRPRRPSPLLRALLIRGPVPALVQLPHQQRRPRTQVLPPPPKLAHVNDG
ncbi:YSIRK-type signal peptide-containing protein [Limosilactobacillus fermentum]|uniref:YSIRK-type signal peptide-containing protein n=1 Tax=Limosilactobacillus fermentum TaxID=1613 RepID=UPI0021A8544A|nr:YSIRK-type signal peptide-containing protein [Limosilactobacillus fermentum]